MLIINGKVLEPGAPESTFLNRAFKFGDGLFEEIRVFKGKPLFLEAHLAHILNGMRLLHFEFEEASWSAEIRSSILQSIRLNDVGENGRLRLHVYRSGTGAFAPLDHKPFYLLESYALKDDYFESEVSYSLIDYDEVKLAGGILSSHYAANSLPLTLAAIHASSHDCDAAVMYGPQGVAMSSQGNLFIVKQKKLYTPGLDSACVDQVIRSQLMRLADSLKIPVQEKKLKSKDLAQADEIFLCNTLRGIIPVNQYNDWALQPQHFVITPFLRQCLLQFVQEIS